MEGEGVAQRVAEGDSEAEPDTEGLRVVRHDAEAQGEPLPLRVGGSTLAEALPHTLPVGAALVGDRLGEPLAEALFEGVRHTEADGSVETLWVAQPVGEGVPRVL
jgi:hypothetical protein